MQFPQIRMTSEMAKISIEQIPGRQEIRQPKADLSIEQPSAELSIRTSPSKLTIDQTQAWEEMNLMSTLKSSEQHAKEGMQGVQEGTTRRAEQGTALMRIENGGDPINDQAIMNGHKQMKNLGITFIPSPFAVKYHYEPSDVQIDATVNKPLIDAKRNEPEHQYEQGEVRVDMKQYESLTIDFDYLFSESI